MAKMVNSRLAHIVAEYSKLIGCRISKNTLKKDIDESPFYPTLLCLTRIFAKYRVPNKAFKVEKDDLHLFHPPWLK